MTATTADGAELSPVGRFVARRVSTLQAGYRADHAHAVASLARLRRAISHAPGADPEVWSLTLDGFDSHAPDDRITREEWAIHGALCLYALHQQGRSDRAHRPGPSLGAAARSLSQPGTSEAATRRFQAIATAVEFPEIMHHTRGLVMQLRGSGDRSLIALDYGLLADHLTRLQNSQRADRVRLRWGRDFYVGETNRESSSTESELAE